MVSCGASTIDLGSCSSCFAGKVDIDGVIDNASLPNNVFDRRTVKALFGKVNAHYNFS